MDGLFRPRGGHEALGAGYRADPRERLLTSIGYGEHYLCDVPGERVAMTKGKVLVVDDERPVVMVIETNLRIAGYEVVSAYNGQQALELLRRERPDCMILDVVMPEMNGWEVLQRVREDRNLAKTQVIMLTALVEDADIARGYELGVDMYLTKPFEPKELIEFVDRVVELGREEALYGQDPDDEPP